MPESTFLTGLIIGLCVGGLGTFLLIQARFKARLLSLQDRLEFREEELNMHLGQIKAFKEREYQLDHEREQLRQQTAVASANVQAWEQHAQHLNRQLEFSKSESSRLQQQVTRLTADLAGLSARTDREKTALKEKELLIEEARKNLGDTFKALSADALQQNNKAFQQLAKSAIENLYSKADADLEKRQQTLDQLVKPLQSSLENVNTRIKEIEHARTSAYASLREQITSMA